VSALQAAAAFYGGKALEIGASPQDVLKVAETFEQWLEREPSS
jgi:hypothetical protein